jgi:hypothetical protein
MLGPRGSIIRITLSRGRRVFGLQLKRGSWGPEHAIVTDEETDMAMVNGGALWSVSTSPSESVSFGAGLNVTPVRARVAADASQLASGSKRTPVLSLY